MVAVELTLAPCTASAQVVQVLHSFTGCQVGGCAANDGKQPAADLVVGPDGSLYGTTGWHGADVGDYGTVFRVALDGTVTKITDFYAEGSPWEKGAIPTTRARLHLAGGVFYGVTNFWGLNGDGTLFSVTAGGALAKVVDFDNGTLSDGFAQGGVTTGVDGLRYLVGTYNGASILYRVEANGSLTTVHQFAAGESTPGVNLITGSDGNIYGMSNVYPAGGGVIYRIAPDGSYSELHRWPGSDGSGPVGTLVEGPDNAFYGATFAGGPGGGATCSCGVVFRVGFDGAYSILHAFGVADGYNPQSGVVFAPDGNMYGTTSTGGLHDHGSLYRLTLGGAFTAIHHFSGTDGSGPNGGLAVASDGNLYGTTYAGGTYDLGTVFRVILKPANLLLSSLSAPPSVAVDAAFSVVNAVKNLGVSAAGASTARLWLSADQTVGAGDIEIGSRPVPALAVGKASSGSTPVNLAGIAPGSYFLLGEADADDAVAESNEADNVRARKLIIGGEYVVSSVTLSPLPLTHTSPTSITVGTRNTGAPTEVATVTRLYKSSDDVLDGGDQLLQEFAVSALATNQISTNSVSLVLPAGKYRLIVQVDAAGQVAEGNEANNLKVVRVTVN
jgi:uncharacterized repeat protein (TIGR03803 family)